MVSEELFPSRCSMRTSFLCLFPGFSWLLAVLGMLWLTDASAQCLPLSTHGILPACVGVSVFSHRVIKTPVILNVEPNLIEYNLLLTNYICKDYFKIRSQSWVPGECELFGRAIQHSTWVITFHSTIFLCSLF